jgi:hypothetical protein
MNESRRYSRERRHLSRRSLTKAELADPSWRELAGKDAGAPGFEP